MWVYVTQNDIDNGRTGSPKYCPVALATDRAAKRIGIKYGKAYIGIQSIDVYGFNESFFVAKTPERVRKFIKLFDDLLEVKPFRFKLENEIGN